MIIIVTAVLRIFDKTIIGLCRSVAFGCYSNGNAHGRSFVLHQASSICALRQTQAVRIFVRGISTNCRYILYGVCVFLWSLDVFLCLFLETVSDFSLSPVCDESGLSFFFAALLSGAETY